MKIPNEHVIGAKSVEQIETCMMYSERRAFFKGPRSKGIGTTFFDMFVAAGFEEVRVSVEAQCNLKTTGLELEDQSAEDYTVVVLHTGAESSEPPVSTNPSTDIGDANISYFCKRKTAESKTVLPTPKRMRKKTHNENGAFEKNFVPPPRAAG